MNPYGIKRGHYANIEGDKLKNLMKEIFGNANIEGDKLVSTYGALDPLTAWIDGKKVLYVDTVMNPKVDNDVASETIARYNDFLLRATGFTSKERKKKANKK